MREFCLSFTAIATKALFSLAEIHLIVSEVETPMNTCKSCAPGRRRRPSHLPVAILVQRRPILADQTALLEG